jgi:hypothetical protein
LLIQPAKPATWIDLEVQFMNKSLMMILLTAVLAIPATAATVNATNTGWWDNTGFHGATNLNYGTGTGAGADHRSFFVFDLAGLSGAVLSATFEVFNPATGYNSPNPTETINFFDVSTPIATLIADGSGQTAIFTDLGSGSFYGARVFNAADNNSLVSIALSAAAVAGINASLGSRFAIGGALSNPGDVNIIRGVFLNSNGSEIKRLQLTVVPEPGTLALASLSLLLGIAGLRRRRD